MAFTINFDASTMQCAAGEAIAFSFQPCSSLGIPESLTGRAFVFTVWADGASVPITYQDAAIVTLLDGSHAAQWEFDGETSIDYLDHDYRWGIYERLHGSRLEVATGNFVVTSSAPRVDDFTTAPTSDYITRIQRWNDPSTIDAPKLITTIAPFVGSAPISSAITFDFSHANNSGLFMLI